MRNIWLTAFVYTRFIFATWEDILLLDCGSALYSIRPDDMYTHCEARSVKAGNNIVLLPDRVRESSERGEGIDEMMHTIDRHMYTIKAKVYDVRIAQGQAPTSDYVKRNIEGYGELDSTRGHLLE